MQSIYTLSERPNISEEVTQTLRHMISDGRLAEGSRINEVQLSKSLGVSRTPLREALMGLVAEGALKSIPRRGYFVEQLSTAEFQSLYAIRVLLDPEALKTSRTFSTQQLDELDTLNQAMAFEHSVDESIDLDDQFHLGLIAGCDNTVLVDLIKQFMSRTRRYEYAYMKQAEHQSNAITQHDAILSCLRADDRSGACEALRINLTSGIAPITEWLSTRTQKI
ncbi:MAG: GntR family transcriptional regulator [Gammaproteobacteria bacterium]